MGRKLFWGFCFCILAGALVFYLAARASAELPFKVKEVRFFESGYEAGDLSQHIYSQDFFQTKTRYINCQLLLADIPQQTTMHVVWKFYYPDTCSMGEVPSDVTAEAGERYIWQGWGWKNPGEWDVGNHRVDVYINGEKAATGYFTIVNDTGIPLHPEEKEDH